MVKNRIDVWKRWRKYNLNSRTYQFLVLIGLVHSPTFSIDLFIRKVLNDKNKFNRS